MAYDGWELGFESSRNGARTGQWTQQNIAAENELGHVWDEWERGSESSRTFSPVDKKLSHCTVGKDAQLVLLDSDVIIWEK